MEPHSEVNKKTHRILASDRGATIGGHSTPELASFGPILRFLGRAPAEG